MRARRIFKTKSAPVSADMVGGEGWALPLVRTAFRLPSNPHHKARTGLSLGQHVQRTDLAGPLWCASYTMRPDARTRHGSGGPGVGPKPRPACLLCCQDAFGRCYWQGAPPRLPARAQIAGSLAPAQQPSHALCRAEHAVSMQHITAVTGCQ